jgi:hypothetical protein
VHVKFLIKYFEIQSKKPKKNYSPRAA